jgi:hypothetical protein
LAKVGVDRFRTSKKSGVSNRKFDEDALLFIVVAWRDDGGERVVHEKTCHGGRPLQQPLCCEVVGKDVFG